MTDAEALQQARRRWGREAYIREQKGYFGCFKVGVKDGVLFRPKGQGRTWEEALAWADRNEKHADN